MGHGDYTAVYEYESGMSRVPERLESQQAARREAAQTSVIALACAATARQPKQPTANSQHPTAISHQPDSQTAARLGPNANHASAMEMLVLIFSGAQCHAL